MSTIQTLEEAGYRLKSFFESADKKVKIANFVKITNYPKLSLPDNSEIISYKDYEITILINQ